MFRSSITKFFVKLPWSSAAFIFFERLLRYDIGALFACIGGILDLEAVFSAKVFFDSIGVSLQSYEDPMFLPVQHDFNFLYLFNTSLAKLSKLPSFCLIIGSNIRFEAPLLSLRLAKLVSLYKVGVYRIGTSIGYLSFKTRYLSNNLKSFFDITEFKHPFCKNFYLPLFSYRPFILLGYAALISFGGVSLYNAVTDFISRLMYLVRALSFWIFARSEFCFFGILNTYSTRIHTCEVGFQPGKLNFSSLITPPDFKHKYAVIVYSIGFDITFLSEFLQSRQKRFLLPVTWTVYQGTHGNGFASHANLILPTLSHIEYTTFYKNLLGFVQKSSIAVSYDFDAKTSQAVFKFFLEILSRHYLFSFSGFSFLLSVSFN